MKIFFITQHIPTGTLNLFKKVAEYRLQDFKEELDLNLEFNYNSLIKFKDPKQKDLFAKISKLFNSKEDMTISEKEIYNNFDKKEVDNLFDYYPDFFQKKIIDEKIFWIMHGKIKEIKNID